MLEPSGPQLPNGRLLEGIVTTCGADGNPHIAPMGPIVDDSFSELLLRPFHTSQTYRNLKRTGNGVLHVTDDVELFARSAVGKLDVQPRLLNQDCEGRFILADACRWYAFRVLAFDASQERVSITAQVVDHGELRSFFGFNRAKHAVIEAAILATRLHILEPASVLNDLGRLRQLVTKTGAQQEHAAFDFLHAHIKQAIIDQTKSQVVPK